jgi:hypothetical protein
MSESTRLGGARGKMLPIAIVAAALLATLVVIPSASAAPNPIAGGATTLTIDNGLLKSAKEAGIKITPLKPSKIKGSKATFAVTGGEIEATTGRGTIAHSGGLKIAWGKKSVTLKSFTVNTRGKTLSAKMGGKTIKVATLTGVSATRLGFGNAITAKSLKLTPAAAKSLNRKLTPASPFKANSVIGSSTTEVEPETDNVLARESMVFNGNAGLLGKLAAVGVKVETISPTTASGTQFSSAISGGTISPIGTSGQVDSAGGIKLVQVLTQGPSTSITLGSIGVDLAAKIASVEVIGESNAVEPGSNPARMPLDLGKLPPTSIADLKIGSVTASPATRSVVVSATATIQPVAAEVLEGFVKVYEGWYKGVVEAESKGTVSGEAAAKVAAEKTANNQIKSGEALGSFSFTAIGE